MLLIFEERKMNLPIKLKTSSSTGAAKMRSLLKQLYGEAVGMERSLLEAALAGQELSAVPNSPRRRRRAAEAWAKIAGILAKHLTEEEEILLPWLEPHHQIPATILRRIRERHRKVRVLSSALAKVSFEHGSKEKAVRAGNSLLKLAITLDDLIAGEEKDLFPILRHVLFKSNHLESRKRQYSVCAGTNHVR